MKSIMKQKQCSTGEAFNDKYYRNIVLAELNSFYKGKTKHQYAWFFRHVQHSQEKSDSRSPLQAHI